MTDIATEPTLADWELQEIDRANASGLQPIVFVHGLWLLSSSWEHWRNVFEEAGYVTVAPGWPDDPQSVEEARRDPDVFAHKMVQQVADHYLEAIRALQRKPAVVGHSFGGMIALKLAGEGVAAATVAIDFAPFKGVLPLPLSSLKSASPVLGNPGNVGRAIALTFEQFQYGWANALPEEEAQALYHRYHVAASGVPLFQAAVANFNPFGGETQVDHKNPDRGPLLVIAGTEDHTVPLAITRAGYKIEARNEGVTEIAEIPGRGHSLTIDSGWHEVAETALAFLRRFV
jgi:non-heme chloroperoxidase